MSVHDENNHVIYKCNICHKYYPDNRPHICNHTAAYMENTKHRLTIEEYGCLLSLIGKGRSEDPFTHCSSVAISVDKRILGISYNGLKAGMKIPEWMLLEENRVKKSDYFIHAERNMFSLLRKGECHTICINLSPCLGCCQDIAAMDIKNVIYIKEYHRCDKFKEFFKFYNINYRELNRLEKQNIKNYLNNMNNFTELE